MSGPLDSARSSDAPHTEHLYVVATWLPRAERIVVGSLGTLDLRRGWYAYVGSARRGRAARVARHMRPDKPHRWHADYLFARHPARQAWLIDGYGGSSECALAAALASAASAARVGSLPPGRPTRAPSSLRPRAFGASDCGCPGHLVVFRHREHLRGAVQEAIGAVNGNLVRE